jgi:hypothetical protein
MRQVDRDVDRRPTKRVTYEAIILQMYRVGIALLIIMSQRFCRQNMIVKTTSKVIFFKIIATTTLQKTKIYI